MFLWAQVTLLNIFGETKLITQAVRNLSTAPAYLLPEGAFLFSLKRLQQENIKHQLRLMKWCMGYDDDDDEAFSKTAGLPPKKLQIY